MSEKGDESPEIYALKKDGGGWSLSRRDFLKTAVAAGAAAAMIGKGGGAHAEEGIIAGGCAEGVFAHQDSIRRLLISPDGANLYSVGEESFKRWMLPSGAFRRALNKADYKTTILTFFADASAVVMGWNSWIVLLSLPDLEQIAICPHTTDWTILAVSKNRKTLAVGYNQGAIELWSVPPRSPTSFYVDTCSLLSTICGSRSHRVIALAISPNGKYLAAAHEGIDESPISVWSLTNGTLLKELKGNVSTANSLVFSPDSALLIAGGDNLQNNAGEVLIWSLPDLVLKAKLSQVSGQHINKVEVSPDGRFLIACGYKSDIGLWSLRDGFTPLRIDGPKGGSCSFAVSSDSSMVAVGGLEGGVTLWSLNKNASLAVMQGHTKDITALAFSPDGKTLASGSLDNTIKLWSLPEAKDFTCLMDLFSSYAEAKGRVFEFTNPDTSFVERYTLPCGSIHTAPAGAVCSCDCVAGYMKRPGSSGSGSGSSTYSSHYWHPN